MKLQEENRRNDLQKILYSIRYSILLQSKTSGNTSKIPPTMIDRFIIVESG
jgi:hypothetical protein